MCCIMLFIKSSRKCKLIYNDRKGVAWGWEAGPREGEEGRIRQRRKPRGVMLMFINLTVEFHECIHVKLIKL